MSNFLPQCNHFGPLAWRWAERATAVAGVALPLTAGGEVKFRQFSDDASVELVCALWARHPSGLIDEFYPAHLNHDLARAPAEEAADFDAVDFSSGANAPIVLNYPIQARNLSSVRQSANRFVVVAA